MKYLVDTGVLLRLFDIGDPHCTSIRSALRMLRANGDQLVFTAQNAAEFWNVSTRPASARGGYGHDIGAVNRRLDFIERFGGVLFETHASYEKWKELLVAESVSGVSVHDARLVAVMITSGITHVISLNTADFSRYQEVAAVTPDDVLQGGQAV